MTRCAQLLSSLATARIVRKKALKGMCGVTARSLAVVMAVAARKLRALLAAVMAAAARKLRALRAAEMVAAVRVLARHSRVTRDCSSRGKGS
jgi:hypothetical protein